MSGGHHRPDGSTRWDEQLQDQWRTELIRTVWTLCSLLSLTRNKEAEKCGHGCLSQHFRYAGFCIVLVLERVFVSHICNMSSVLSHGQQCKQTNNHDTVMLTNIFIRCHWNYLVTCSILMQGLSTNCPFWGLYLIPLDFYRCIVVCLHLVNTKCSSSLPLFTLLYSYVNTVKLVWEVLEVAQDVLSYRKTVPAAVVQALALFVF